MQILELVLYGYNNKVRHLCFKLGQVNIITGRSKSGKSAIGDIIDYCLGSNSCNIADGVVRENVAWYGLLLQFENEQVFVARKNPSKKQQSSTECYIEIGTCLKVPKHCTFFPNTNVSGIEDVLTKRVGILENISNMSGVQSMASLAANIRHSLFYCFQGQDEIAAKNFLFHRQSEDFITQTIKNTIPYFLGAISDDVLILEHEKNILKQSINKMKRKIDENKSLVGNVSEMAIKLIGEAREVGLVDPEIKIDYRDFNSMISILKNILEWVPNEGEIPRYYSGRLSLLQYNLRKHQIECDEITVKINTVKSFAGDYARYIEESKLQKIRLESIGLFEQLDFNSGKCPFCSGDLEHPIPSVEMMKTSIINLDKIISNVPRENPRLVSIITNLEKEREQKIEEIKTLKSEIDGIYQEDNKIKHLRDMNVCRGEVIGKISLWIESVNANTDLEEQQQKIIENEKRIQEINEIIDKESVDEQKQYALSLIRENMTKWAKELNLEYSDCPYRIDLNKMTVVVDKHDRPVPLKQLGSGSNWVGVHLITYFALQHYFIHANRPVPRFLFLDQPSQVYFPSESNEKNIDWQEVTKVYKFIVERVIELNGKLQVIIVDHADFTDDYFEKYICEKWWLEDNNLIPNDWYK